MTVYENDFFIVIILSDGGAMNRTIAYQIFTHCMYAFITHL